ncbi:alpha/beta fold hydrolase [Paraburkholderia sp. 2C]
MPFDHYTPFRVLTDDVEINGVKGGSGPPLLLLHGHSHTHAVWHRCAQPLAEHFTVIATDLRGYGASAMPHGAASSHELPSRRVMAADQIAVMRHFGYARFLVCAHDRGAHVAHRMALDHTDAVERLMLLDIAPAFEADVHAARAAATTAAAAANKLDLEHDRADIERGTKIGCPLRVLWGTHGVPGRAAKPLAEWRKVARDVSGRALPCGHAIPEEAPDELMAEMLSFFEAIDR